MLNLPYSSALLRSFCSSLLALFILSQTYGVGPIVGKDKDDTNFEDLNFTFDTPAWPWVQIPAGTMGEDTTLAYRKTINDAFFIIIAEQIGVEYGFGNEHLVDTAVSNMRSVAPKAEFSDPEEVEINGIKWSAFTGKAKMMGQPFVYGYLVYADKGYSYQLMSWREGEFAELAKSDVLELGAGFKLIDADKVWNSEDFQPVGKFADETAGFSIDLEGDGWSTWEVGKSEMPQSVFTATKGNELFFFAIPLYHPELNPSFKELKNALLSSVFEIDGSGLNSRDKIVRADGGRYLQSSFSFESYFGVENTFLVQVRKYEGFSYFIGAYSEDPARVEEAELLFPKSMVEAELDVDASLASLGEEQRFFQAQAMNQLAVIAYSQNNYINAKRYLERSLSFDKSDPAVASNYAIVSSEQGDYQAIIDLYDAAPQDLEENYPFLEYYGFALAQLGKVAEAEKAYADVFDSGNMSESGLWYYMDLLGKEERWKEAIVIAEDFNELTGSQSALQWAASYYNEIKEYDTALSILNDLKADNPFELSLDYDIAHVFLSQEKYSKTVEYIEELGGEIDSYPLIYTLKGNAFFGLKSYLKAKECYARAIELNPMDEEAKSMLEYATLALGKGDTDVNTTPIEPVPMPEFLAEKAKQAETLPLDGKESVILYTIQSIHYEKEKVSKQTTTTKVAIRDDAGLDAYSTLSFPFDPFFEEVYVNEIIVRDGEGQVITKEKRDDFYLLDNNSEMIVSQDRSLYVPVSGLTKNCTLEYTVSYNTTGLIDEFPLKWQGFAYLQKSFLCGVSVSGQIESVASFVSDAMVEASTGSELIWYAENVSGYKDENYQADLETFVPYLVLTEKSLSWESEVAEYFGEISDRLVTSPEIAALAKELTEEAATYEEKLSAIYGYIQSEFTYKALAFGPRAQIPNTADKIVADKYGDCKDLALLANRLFDAVGIRSHLALVNTSAKVQTQLPSLDQFDHMILYLPDYKDGHFLDCTSQHVALDLTTPLGLEERKVLVLDADAPHFVEAPKQVLEENTITSDKRIEIVDDAIHVEETLLFSGLPAAYFRYYLASLQDSQVIDAFQGLMTSKSSQNLRLEDIEAVNLKEVDEPLKVVMSYNIPRVVKQNARGLTISHLPAVWESYYLGVPFSRDRQTPFKVRNPISFESTLTVKVPGGHRLSEEVLDEVERDSGFHTFTFQRMLDESLGQLSLSSKIIQLPSEGSKDQFGSFQGSSQDALSLITDPLEFERIKQ